VSEDAANVIALREPALAQGELLHVLKHDDLFAVFDPCGNIHGRLHPVGPSSGADGLFQDDTRVLSLLRLEVAGQMPELLGGSVGLDNVVFSANLANPVFKDKSGRLVAPTQLHLHRRRLLWNCKLYEAILIQNFSAEPVAFDLTIDFDADFRDVFEIRGARRKKRGDVLQPRTDANRLFLSYQGLDGKVRSTTISFSVPVTIRGKRATVPIELAPGARRDLLMVIASNGDLDSPSRRTYFAALKASKRSARRNIANLNLIEPSNDALATWLSRAAADLSLLVTELDTGPYPYAGIPWFSVPFGRDAVVTALQVLWLDPSIARGVLAFLSSLQAQEGSSFLDAEPGKIMHERRKGEMAALREVPFGRYYGGVDTTPLFVILAGAYLKRTNDVAFLRQVWSAVCAALDWIDNFGDLNSDGFVEYRRSDAGGLQNQGWKDSADSIFHSDGRLAEGPIALVEVQAYIVAAKRAASQIAQAIGEADKADRLLKGAEHLQDRFERAYWCDRIDSYALALDGAGRQCAVRASNAGHILYCGVASQEKADRTGRSFMSPSYFSGWGLRTVAAGESRYNPMSYHNGTIWPHDCSIAAAGLARYGMSEAAGRLFTGLFEAVCRFPNFRLPELFCGFPRRAGEGPVSYPSACTPQAWASGSVFLMLQACLGIQIDAPKKVVEVSRAYLPPWLNKVVVRGLSIGTARLTLRFEGRGAAVDVGLVDADERIQLLIS
jgi:glycogen debranching enzyme